MKTYATKYFNAEYLKDTNICDVGVYVWTPYLNIKDEFKNDFDIFDDEEDAYVSLDLISVDEILNDPTEIEYNIGSDFDEWEYDSFIENLIKPFNHYIVCAYHCTWDRRSGYKIVDELKDAFYRDYDCHQYYGGGSIGGKSILIYEYSHDAPMGYSTMIIGLTDKEYDKLSYWNVDFETVFKFADEHSEKIIEI